MNYYAFHIGDFAAATRHLSWDERAAYREMIDVYYAREEPLPLDVKMIYRLVMATEPHQRQAVDAVLAEFFTLADDGYHNNRCDEEISKANSKIDGSAARREAERERQRRHRERRKELFESLRSEGVTPAFDTPTVTLEAMAASRASHAPVTRDSHTPVTGTLSHLQRLPNPNPNPNPISKIEEEDNARAGDHFEVVTRDLCAIPELQTHPVAVNPVIAAIWTLVQQGYDLKTQIIPSIRKQTQTARNPIKSWGYFVRGIIDDNAIAKQEAPNGTRTPRRKPSASTAMRDAFDDLQSAIAGPNSTA